MMFLFEKLRDNPHYNELEKYKEVNSDLAKDILEQAAKLTENLILPLAKAGDQKPTKLENGVVITPPGYKEAYKKFIEDGWVSLSCDPEYRWSRNTKNYQVHFLTKCYPLLVFLLSSTASLSIGAYNCILHHGNRFYKEKISS